MHDERVARVPRLHLVGRAVALRVTLVVAVPAVGGRLHDGGPAPAPDGLDHLLHGRRGGHDVVAVHRDVVDPVAGGATLERRGVLVGRGGELRVAVVLAEEHDREMPHGGEVHRLVERALGHRPVTEERHRDAAVRPQLGRRRRPHRDRQAGTHDPVRAEDPDVRIGDVHRASTAAVRALIPAHQLGEHPEGVQPLGQAVAVPPMGRRDDVRGTERPAGAHCGCLLPDREVDEARYLARSVELGHALLEATDHQHPPVHLEQVVVGGHEDLLYWSVQDWERDERTDRRPAVLAAWR